MAELGAPDAGTKVLRAREKPPSHEFRPARRQVPEYHSRRGQTVEGSTARGFRHKSGGVDFGADNNRAGHRSQRVDAHVYHNKSEQAHFTVKATPMMFSNDYRPGRRVSGYGSVRGNGLQNPVTGEGVPPVAHERRGKRGLREAPSLELQKMNDQMHNLPAERQPQHSPQRRVKEMPRPEPEAPSVRPIGKKVHGTARRDASIQEYLAQSEQRAVTAAKPTPASAAHFAEMCAETKQAVQERRLWGQIFKARGQDSLKLS